MDSDTQAALALVARILSKGWDKNKLTGGLSPREAVGYMILHRVGSRLHPDQQAKTLSDVVVSLVGVSNLSIDPPPKGSGSFSLWLMNQGAN